MRENTVLRKWRAGQPTIGTWLSLPSAYASEVMAHQGFDWACIDMQHGVIDYPDAVQMLTAISTTTTIPFVRVPWNEPSMIMKVLDAGAYGVVIPMVNNRSEAEQAVAACRYPPAGYRSNGANRAVLYGGRDYVANANREIACIPMIETKQGIENLDEILSTPGVDAIYVGPADLSFALGLTPEMDSEKPLHVETCRQIVAACQRHGVIAGIHTGGPAFTVRRIKEGFQMVTLTSDGVAMQKGVRAQWIETAKLLGEIGVKVETTGVMTPY